MESVLKRIITNVMAIQNVSKKDNCFRPKSHASSMKLAVPGHPSGTVGTVRIL